MVKRRIRLPEKTRERERISVLFLVLLGLSLAATVWSLNRSTITPPPKVKAAPEVRYKLKVSAPSASGGNVTLRGGTSKAYTASTCITYVDVTGAEGPCTTGASVVTSPTVETIQ